MIGLLTAAEMRAADAEAVHDVGVKALMLNAGARIAEFIRREYPQGRIVAFAGPGNNGGDAFEALALLRGERQCAIYAAGGRDGAQPLPQTFEEARRLLEGAALAIDALFGTGARLPLSEEMQQITRALDRAYQPVLAIDIPSGIDADTGAVDTDAVRATATIALGALKPGLLLEPARENAGDVWLADIGIDDAALSVHAKRYSALDDAAFLDLLPLRAVSADKRSAGAPLVIAGSVQFPGAAVLCARGAARAGAGYVTVATSSAAAPVLRTHLIEQVVVDYEMKKPEKAAEALIDIARRNSAVAIGPGLGLDDWTGKMMRAFIERLELPFVLDASGLFHIAKHLELLRGKRCVVTPHAGEFARLSGEGTVRENQRVTRLRKFVERTGIITLLKGNTTLVDDGTTVAVNLTGSNALATAGTGDTLTGIISTLLSQGLSPFDAACAGAYWHGLAGRYCKEQRGIGVVASDVAEALGPATRRLRSAPVDALRQVVASSIR